MLADAPSSHACNQILQRGEHTLLCSARMPSQRRIACRLAAQCELVAAEVCSLARRNHAPAT